MRTFLAAAMLLATPPAVLGQELGKCAPDSEVTKALGDVKQKLVTIGFISQEAVYALYASPGGDNWTSIIYRADGMMCVVAVGTELSRVIVEPRGEKV